ncbi:ABC transporter permease [Macrococcus armenti]|uniref:ABC transporter permease n=1 Tax=Macrococcus armenti TaxID=2875764 RepID=UPI001CCDA42B|nr:ABC transporter permease [Macrococcus armenti]UBH16058.1 ABC transporter permease [Macrococcus armenti]UBH18418.1 ABC transporter permease [Macrococcus armenti]UBH20685.1 ABC transporter permease [Macrococcus armenti]
MMTDILYAEFVKFKGMFKRYYVDSIAEIISYLILFSGLTYAVVIKNNSDNNIVAQLLIGIFVWYIGINAIAIFTFILQEEMQLGTLEQIYLTKTNLSLMLMGRAIATFIFDAIGGIILTSGTLLFIFVFSPNLIKGHFNLMPLINPLMIIILILTMLGIYGFSFLLAGLSIIFKRISAITVILNYIFLFFTGVLVSGNNLPYALDTFSKCLPITWGIININGLFNDSFSYIDLLGLFINTSLYFSVGIITFNRMTYYARKKGSLNQY